MKLEVFRTNLGDVFNPNKKFTSDKSIVLNRHPKEPTEGATLGYLDEREKNFYKTADIKGQINDTKILQIQGPDLIHNNNGLFVKEVISKETPGSIFEVDEYGRVIKVHPLKDEDLSGDITLNWSDITDKPTSLEGYGINDLVPSDKNTELTGKITVSYQSSSTKSPVPFSYLKNKFYSSGYELKPGMMVIKVNKPNAKKWLPADGRVIYKKDYPKAVSFLAGSNATQARLPDSRYHDRILLEAYGVDAKTYVRVDD